MIFYKTRDRFSLKSIRPRYQWLSLIALLLGLLATRRWQQVVLPQVWVEDGSQILEKFIAEGWLAFFEPVNSYLITIPKILSFIALKVSFTNYPLIATIFAWLFVLMVGLAIAYSPTKLHGKVLCAVLVFMTPADPEVFGLPSYTFWWASLLLFLLPLWDEKVPLIWWRLGVIILCGLSSPVIVVILPILYLRSYWYRSLRAEHVVAFSATLIAAVQIYFILHSSGAKLPPIGSLLKFVLPKFFGTFLIGNWTNNVVYLWLAGMVVLSLIIVWLINERHNVSSWILFYLLLLSIVITVARVDPAIIHPKLAGPRYFFLPFIFIFWILIQYFHVSSKSTFPRIFIGIVIAVAVINAKPVWSRNHDDLHWKNHVHSGRLFSEYALPVHYDGNQSSKYFLKLSGKNCAELLKADLLFSQNEFNKVPTFPYRVLKVDKAIRDERESAMLISSTMSGTDYQKTQMEGYRVIGSFNTSDADIGEVSLKLRRGNHILYRSGPSTTGQSVIIEGQEHVFLTDLPLANEWVKLLFSNSKLPPQFIVIIKDNGQNFGEWSAVAIRD